jgi:hypothetical protein
MRSDKYILGENGEPKVEPDLLKWAAWFETGDRKIAAREENGVRVSTVFLGLDHQWGDGPPLLFETMIFGGPHDELQWRYSTRSEAMRGHDSAVDLAFSSPNPSTEPVK